VGLLLYYLANRQTLERVESAGHNLLACARCEISRVVEKFVDRVAFQVVAHFTANFALNRLTSHLLITLSSVLLELVKSCHDDSFAEWTIVLGDRQRTMDMRDMTVIGLNLVENFRALFTLYFRYWTLVSDVRFPTSEFLKLK